MADPKANVPQAPQAGGRSADPAVLNIDESYLRPGDTPEVALRERAMSMPEVRAASVVQKLEGEVLNINKLAKEMREQVAQVQGGNMARAEAMLTSQAHSLDALFSNLARRSITNMDAGHGEAAERYMRLALKAQAQCRTTIEALSAIKNPPVVFAKQANISHGPQQVNNGVPMEVGPRARTIESEQNELGGQYSGLPTDRRAPCVIGATVPAEKAVVEIDRAQD